MNDRELLELAAKAAGIDLTWRHNSQAYYYDDEETGREQWQPLDNDGQALQLAVKLKLKINHGKDWSWCGNHDLEPIHGAAKESCSDDTRAAATRRAIVRAAAEIGKVGI